MVFSSLQFIFIFMPIFFSCYYIVPNKIKNFILFIGSLCFYFVGTFHNPEHFILFILSIVVDFAVGIWIEKFPARKKILLAIGVILHLISLAVFKYSGFVINEMSRLNSSFNFTADIVLPTLEIIWTDGSASTTFSVNAKSPQTGDNSMMALWIAVLFVSGFGVVVSAVYGKKRKSVK